eukprot:scaffold360_cov374-Pavlova_lutheri.AAC.57
MEQSLVHTKFPGQLAQGSAAAHTSALWQGHMDVLAVFLAKLVSAVHDAYSCSRALHRFQGQVKTLGIPCVYVLHAAPGLLENTLPVSPVYVPLHNLPLLAHNLYPLHRSRRATLVHSVPFLYFCDRALGVEWYEISFGVHSCGAPFCPAFVVRHKQVQEPG